MRGFQYGAFQRPGFQQLVPVTPVSAGRWTRSKRKPDQAQPNDAGLRWVWRGHVAAQKARSAREGAEIVRQAREDASGLVNAVAVRFEDERPKRIPQVDFIPPPLDLSGVADAVAQRIRARVALEYAEAQRVAELRLLMQRQRHAADEEAVAVLLLS